MRGVKGGFAQVCHGKQAPLLKMKEGDGFVYYSPRMEMGGTEFCKCFTAIGRIKSDKVYQVEMAPDFHPYRIDIDYIPCRELPIDEVFDQLELTAKKSWGMQLLRGLVEISEADFRVIEKGMVSP